MDAGLLPVKRLDHAKQRLAPHFDAADRRSIADALLEDALALCATTSQLTWWVVSDDDEVLQRAGARGLAVVRDEGLGLNAALECAITIVETAGASSVSVIPSDVPLAWQGDIQDLLDTGATSDIVVVPSSRDGGTNALFLSPVRLIEPRFGPGSLQAHLAEGERSGARTTILALDRLALDIDTLEDVDALLQRPDPAGRRSVALLRSLRGAAAGS
ncbi:MAG: 2-phospho-L-lactate guanylyltransferase [Actinomycetota bacterium]